MLQYCGSCPCVRHGPYLPSISATLQTLGRVECATIHVITIQGSSLLLVLPYSLSVFWKFKNLTLSVTTFPPSLGSCPDTQVRTLASFPSSSYYLLLRVCQTLRFFFSPRVCQTLSSHHPPRLLEIRVCQTLKTHQSILQDEP